MACRLNALLQPTVFTKTSYLNYNKNVEYSLFIAILRFYQAPNVKQSNLLRAYLILMLFCICKCVNI